MPRAFPQEHGSGCNRTASRRKIECENETQREAALQSPDSFQSVAAEDEKHHKTPKKIEMAEKIENKFQTITVCSELEKTRKIFTGAEDGSI